MTSKVRLSRAVLAALLLPATIFAIPGKVAVIDTPWVAQLSKGFHGENRPMERSQPAVVGGILYIASLAGSLVAIDRERGYPMWRKKLTGPVDGAFAYGRARIYVGATERTGDKLGVMRALNARDGSEVWTFAAPTEWLSAPVILRDRVIAVASNDEVYALSEAKGQELWHFTRANTEKITVFGTSTPVAYGNEVFVGFADGYFVALSVETGLPKWEQQLRRTSQRFYDVDATPYVDANDVFIGAYDGRTYRLDRNTGQVRWVFPVGCYGGYVADSKAVYFAGTDGNVYALERSTGKELWKTPFVGVIGQTPLLTGDYLLIPTSGDPTVLLDRATGKQAAQVRLGAGTFAGATLADDGTMYVLSNYGNLFSFRIRHTPEPIARAAKRPSSFTGSVRIP